MQFRAYQMTAATTDQVPGTAEHALIVPLLGLVGEAGVLLSEYKKFLRDGDAHCFLRVRVAEELGDILWYVANVATKFDLDLDKLAMENLAKTKGASPRRSWDCAPFRRRCACLAAAATPLRGGVR